MKRRRRPFAIKTNPAHGFEKFDYEKRKRFLSDDEIPIFWRACDKLQAPFGPLFQLLLLTGCRRSEIAFATWSEIDLKAKTLAIPAARAKNGREHVVFLSDQAVAIIELLPRFGGCQWLFTTRGNQPSQNFSKAKERLDSFMEGVPAWRTHDLRKTFATNCAKLHVALPVAERMLNHALTVDGQASELAALYNLNDYEPEARAAWQTWANRVRTLVEGTPANVVPMVRA